MSDFDELDNMPEPPPVDLAAFDFGMVGTALQALPGRYVAETPPIENALYLANLGWAVFPCREKDGKPYKDKKGVEKIPTKKQPYTPNGKDDATTDPAIIGQWWARWPGALIGVYCEASGFIAVDIDTKNGIDGLASWQALIDTLGNGVVDCGPIQTTPTGGQHWLFKNPQKIKVPNNAGKLAPGLDLRSNGYICTGVGYQWLAGHGPETAITNAPGWLLAEIEKMTAKPKQTAKTAQTTNETTDPGGYWLRHYLAQARPGNRNDTGWELACQLRDSRLSESEATGIMQRFAASVPGSGYSESEALASLKSAYAGTPREPATLPGTRAPKPSQAADGPQADDTVFFVGKDQEKLYKSRDYIAALGKLGYLFRLCELDDMVEVNGQPFSDVAEAQINTALMDVGIYKLNRARAAWITEAAKNSYNPIREYLDRLAWNGTDWITTLGAHFTDEDDFFPVLLRRWLIGAVARIYRPGAQNRMLVLDGKQGIGKSQFVAWLASPLSKHFQEGGIQAEDKDHQLRLASIWIWEVSEMGSTTRRQDVDALKSFLTQKDINVRPPYAHYPIHKNAITSFIGTVNNIGGVLNDASGNRRFMAAKLQSIDFDYTKIDVNQVWAQAVALYRAGEPWQLGGVELERVNEINSRFEVDNLVEDLILERFDVDPTKTDWFEPTTRIVDGLHASGWHANSPTGEMMAIAQAMVKLGLGKKYANPQQGPRTKGYVGLKAKQPKPPEQ